MVITSVQDLIKIVQDASRNGYFPEVLINGEYYPVRIKGLIMNNGYIIKGHERLYNQDQ